MNEDFEGALEDVPQEDRDADSGGDDSADEGQLEQQMGEVGPEGEAVDERMWGPQDEAETQQQPQQQQADAAPVQVRTGFSSRLHMHGHGCTPCHRTRRLRHELLSYGETTMGCLVNVRSSSQQIWLLLGLCGLVS